MSSPRNWEIRYYMRTGAHAFARTGAPKWEPIFKQDFDVMVVLLNRVMIDETYRDPSRDQGPFRVWALQAGLGRPAWHWRLRLWLLDTFPSFRQWLEQMAARHRH